MTDNSLYSNPKPRDEFRTESPLRGFAEYTEFGGWLIAKGFRPSMQHLVRYLAAMESREGYRLVQVLEAATGVPTMIFRTTARASLDMIADAFKPAEIERGNAALDEQVKQYLGSGGFTSPVDDRLKPQIADYETDEEGKPWKLHVRFGGERAVFFANFLRGDRHDEANRRDDDFNDDRPFVNTWSFEGDDLGMISVQWRGQWINMLPAKEEIDHSSHYIVEWFDNVTQTVHRQPIADWPEWAQKLAGPAPGEDVNLNIPRDATFTHRGMNKEAVERWIENSGEPLCRVLIGSGVSVTDLQPKGYTLLSFGHRQAVFERDDVITDWTPPEGAVYGWWADGRFFITFPHGVGGETARLATPPGYAFYGFHDGSLQKTAFYTEVTSESPVDVLETMVEQVADDLGIEVDRESFEVAREHVAEMVPVGYDIPDELKAEAAEYVISRIKPPAYAAKTLREFKKSFMNPNGTPLPPHDKLDAQLQFIIGGGIDIVVIRNFLASFKMSKQPTKIVEHIVHSKGERIVHEVAITESRFDDANPVHYNGWECGDIGERLSPNGYQILKYCWRLGKKDDPCKELGKALRYLDREVDYLKVAFFDHTLVPNFTGIEVGKRLDYLLDRTANQSQFTADVARFLWDGYTWSDLEKLKAMIADHKATLDCGHGLAI